MKNFGSQNMRNTLRWSDAPFLGFSPLYDRELVDAIKLIEIPKAWDAATKTWWFANGGAYQSTCRVVGDLARVYGVPGDPGPVTVVVQRVQAFDPYATLGVRQDACDEVVTAAYNTLTRVWRPDLACGSGAQLDLINDAYDRIRKERGL